MSFWELMVIAIVALLVLGPERLPGAIRAVYKTVRSVKQFGQQMQAELNADLRTHELHQKLKDAEGKGFLNLTEQEKAALAELKQAAADVNTPVSTSGQSNSTSVNQNEHKS
ncbi:Sec-independent protein translocase protein TatB [Chromatiaceae bacterium AAb-1]|nr:Sec-independent protein translocase protein TatB [Chromatiaceae bacterium AAb-1]